MTTNDVDLSFFDTQEIFTCKKLDPNILPCTLSIVKEFNPYKPRYDKFSHYKIPNNRLDNQFLLWLDRAELTVKHAEVFYRPGTGLQNDAFIHVDGHRVIPGFAKINYILGKSGNTMKWWRPQQVTEKNNMLTPIGTKYLRFDSSECVLLDQVDMSGLYIVNAGIPHSVDMGSATVDEPRICISVTPLCKTTGKNVACNDAYTRLTSCLAP